MSTDTFSFLRSSLWGTPLDLKGQALSHDEFKELTQLATQQAVMGLVSQGLMDEGIRLERDDALNLFALQQSIRRQNKVIDEAVVELCGLMHDEGINVFIFKGQSVGALYRDPGLRQSGDIDFYCHHDDWQKAVDFFGKRVGLRLDNLNSQKDVCFQWKDVTYEMHNQITMFCYPPHQRYWKNVVMPEILSHPYYVKVNGTDIPTLAPTYNALFIFVHIFQHLIADGIALRQFSDWARVLKVQHDEIDVAVLERHLKGIGLYKAYSGLGVLLTDLLGLDPDYFPFTITKNDHERLPALWKNMLERGNFGHNVKYKTKHMMAHGLEHIWRMTTQAREFHHYAPAEAWWHIPSMFRWWGIKIWRMVRKVV